MLLPSSWCKAKWDKLKADFPVHQTVVDSYKECGAVDKILATLKDVRLTVADVQQAGMDNPVFNTVGRFEWQTPDFLGASHINSMLWYIGCC